MIRSDAGGQALAVNVVYALTAPTLVALVWACGSVMVFPAYYQHIWIVPALLALYFLIGKAAKALTDFRNNGGLYYIAAWFLFLVVSLAMVLMTHVI